MSIGDRLQHAWNAFMNKDPTYTTKELGLYSSIKPDRIRLSRGNDKTIITAIYNRIAVDCAAISLKHCRIDKNGRFLEEIDSELNNCLTVEANQDQTSRAFIQDVVMSMLDDGCVGILPTITNCNPITNETFKIGAMRTAKILDWYPKHVKVKTYNDVTGQMVE